MKNIIEIRLHGRGGQGTVTAAELIAVSAFCDGKFSQAFPSFGVERRGAPIMAFARLSDKFVRTREQIYEPEYIIIQDSTLIGTCDDILPGIEKAKAVIINSEKKDWPEIKNKNVLAVPATKIALEKIGKPFINTALVGAFAGYSGLISLESLKKTVLEKFSGKSGDIAQKNIEALTVAYEMARET